jgi:hypothetical protein
MAKHKADDKKLRELVLLVATLSEGDQPFGKIKLNKVLFLADFIAYLRFGHSITGHEYQHLQRGPAPRALLRVVPGLCKPAQPDSDIAVRVDDYYGRELERPFALREADTSTFSADEVRLVSDLVREYWGKNAQQMSDMSHHFVGWALTAMGETIPYHTALIGFRELSADERRIGLGLEKAARACLTAAT